MTTTTPHYLTRVIALARAATPAPGEVMHVNIEHDMDCPLPDGTGPCACHPTITLIRKATSGPD